MKEIKRMLLLDLKVSQVDIIACTEKKELVDLYVKQLSNKELKAMLKACVLTLRK